MAPAQPRLRARRRLLSVARSCTVVPRPAEPARGLLLQDDDGRFHARYGLSRGRQPIRPPAPGGPPHLGRAARPGDDRVGHPRLRLPGGVAERAARGVRVCADRGGGCVARLATAGAPDRADRRRGGRLRRLARGVVDRDFLHPVDRALHRCRLSRSRAPPAGARPRRRRGCRLERHRRARANAWKHAVVGNRRRPCADLRSGSARADDVQPATAARPGPGSGDPGGRRGRAGPNRPRAPRRGRAPHERDGGPGGGRPGRRRAGPRSCRRGAPPDRGLWPHGPDRDAAPSRDSQGAGRRRQPGAAARAGSARRPHRRDGRDRHARGGGGRGAAEAAPARRRPVRLPDRAGGADEHAQARRGSERARPRSLRAVRRRGGGRRRRPGASAICRRERRAVRPRADRDARAGAAVRRGAGCGAAPAAAGSACWARLPAETVA